jgi:cadherin 5 type 2 (VE-cadherin)
MASDSMNTLVSEPALVPCNTSEDRPTAVQSLTNLSAYSWETTLNWQIPAEPKGFITHYIVTAHGIKKDEVVDDRLNLIVRSDDIAFLRGTTISQDSNAKYNYTISNLTAGTTYDYTVAAATSVGPGPSSVITVITPLNPPILKVPANEASPKQIAKSATQRSFNITVGEVFSNLTGPIVKHQIIVSTSNDGNIQNETTIQYYSSSDTARPYIAVECSQFFSACSQNSAVNGRKKRRDVLSYDVVIGTEANCPQVSTKPCNHLLNSGTTYYVFYRTCNVDGLCSSTDFSSPVTTASGVPILAICLGIIIPSVVIIIIVAAVIFYWTRRNKKLDSKPSTPMDREHKPIVEGTGTTSLFPQTTSKPVPMDKFSVHVETMAKDSGLEYTAEYEEIKLVGKDQSWDQADLPCNRAKNRFTNIKPYDVSRVKLLPVEDEDGSDYINASWMPGFNSKREFIATQGPLPSTTDDFWRMVWEYNCRAIVMLTKCIENGRNKCDHYWPTDAESVFYGDLQVTLLQEQTFDSWDIRELQITMGQQVRRLKHFHYVEWPDNGVPDVITLLKFVQTVRVEVPARGGPIVVHCSAGVGRTGTFIAIDTILRQLEQNQTLIDIYGVVYRMRMNRVSMVQTESQYVFIHDAVKFHIESGNTEDDKDSNSNDTADDSLYQNQNELRNFYLS